MATRFLRFTRLAALAAGLLVIQPHRAGAQSVGADVAQDYEHEETRDLVALVDDAAELVRTRGEAAFGDLQVDGSRWRRGESYVFVLDPDGNMLVHADPALEGKNQLALKDVGGKAVVRGLLDAAMAISDKPYGWYHYQWPVPGGLLPRWKSSYVRLVTAPSGKRYVVGSGVYNDRMERVFVADAVRAAVGLIEAKGEAAYPLLHDPTGSFIAKDAYVFVFDPKGVDLVNPAFPNLEGRNLLDLKDTQGKRLIREMLDVVKTRGSGWVDYMWPKPGDNLATQKSAYVSKAKLGDAWVLVGSGVYLADAPRAFPLRPPMTAAEVMALVHDGAALLEKDGERAYQAFRKRGSRWFHDDTYFFVWTIDGVRVFHAAAPEGEGLNVSGMTDVLGRPIGRMVLDVAASRAGEGWIHYMYPEPGDIFPTWKSTFLKRVTLPSGAAHVIGCGIYNMQMEDVFIRDVVNRAAALVERSGREAFGELRDKKGPFVFMDTYVFVDAVDGTELVNAAQPSLEGVNLKGATDLEGRAFVDEYIAAATEAGAWVEYSWYKPGSNEPARKRAFVRKVRAGTETFVVGSGLYVD